MALNIVYLDDEADLCNLFQEAFESSAVRIKAFTDPEDAILDIEMNPPDLIFLDYRLPNTTGDIIAMRLGSSIPLVLITGDLNVSPKASFVKIFKKPYKYQEMQSFISGFLTKG